MGKLKTVFNMLALKTKKHSPELLIVGAGIGTCAAVVLGCKATIKANDILEEHKKNIDTIKEVHESDEFDKEEYAEKDYKKDLTIAYSQTLIRLVKLYGPTILTAAGSLFCMFAAVSILKKRNAALAATCTTLAGVLTDYRQRVKDKIGEEKEFELFNDIHEYEIETVETDKDGNEKTKTKKVKLPSGVSSPFGITFDASNPNWTGDREIDLCFLKAQERYCNDMLVARGILTVNQVREALGLPPIQEGQVFGWAYIKNNPVGDNFVDFGISEDNKNLMDFMKKKNDFIILNLNIDGNILEYFPSCNRLRNRNN